MVQTPQLRSVINKQDSRICWDKSICECECDDFTQAAERQSVNGKCGYEYLKTGFFFFFEQGIYPPLVSNVHSIRKLLGEFHDAFRDVTSFPKENNISGQPVDFPGLQAKYFVVWNWLILFLNAKKPNNSNNRWKSCCGQHAYKASLKFRMNKMPGKKAKVATSKPNDRVVCRIAQGAHRYGGTIIVMMTADTLFYSWVKALVGKVWTSSLHRCGTYTNEKDTLGNSEFCLSINQIFLWDMMQIRSVFEVMLLEDQLCVPQRKIWCISVYC